MQKEKENIGLLLSKTGELGTNNTEKAEVQHFLHLYVYLRCWA